jgi:patatin-like phospholipase/acyl hydrolase
MAKYRILSIDGGGIKGIIPAIIMQRLNQEPGLEGWLDQVDLIAGTSTGGLLALAIAHGLDMQVIRELYEVKGPKVFDDSWIDDVMDLGKIIGADYKTANLRRELQDVLGRDTTLGDLNKRVLITTFDLDNEDPDPERRTWKPKLFHNFPGEDSDANELAYKVGVYTAAAPTYFASEDGYIDGGVYATNPSMCALAQSQDKRFPDRPALSDVVMLSLGTGTSLVYIDGKRLDWGYAQWAKPLVSLMLDGTCGIADYQCRQMLGTNYNRLAPLFPAGKVVDMDSIDDIPYMIDFAQGLDLSGAVAWLKRHWV